MLSRNGENLPTGPAPGQPPTSSLVSFFHLEIETVMTCSWEPLWLQLVAGMSNADRWRSQISWAGDRKTNMPLSQLQIQLGSRFSGTPGQLSCHQAEKVPPKTQRPTGCTHSNNMQCWGWWGRAQPSISSTVLSPPSRCGTEGLCWAPVSHCHCVLTCPSLYDWETNRDRDRGTEIQRLTQSVRAPQSVCSLEHSRAL